MNPRIQLLHEKKLVGLSLVMSMEKNRTYELWSSFMPARKVIKNVLGADRYSIQVYPKSMDFQRFDPTMEFTKWAAVEVADFNGLPSDFETFILNKGLYAVFDYKGLSSDRKIFQYIFSVWLPNSNYLLDDRPHFEVLGEQYKNNDPNSEEAIWIPIKPKD